MEILLPTPETFSPYGWIIEYPRQDTQNREDNLFSIILKETGITGWRIACLIIRNKSIKRLEQHPRSYESFEPLSGETFLFVAHNREVASIRCFSLTKPVILKKGIWHGVVTLKNESAVKITENSYVECHYWPLQAPLCLPLESYTGHE